MRQGGRDRLVLFVLHTKSVSASQAKLGLCEKGFSEEDSGAG